MVADTGRAGGLRHNMSENDHEDGGAVLFESTAKFVDAYVASDTEGKRPVGIMKRKEEDMKSD